VQIVGSSTHPVIGRFDFMRNWRGMWGALSVALALSIAVPALAGSFMRVNSPAEAVRLWNLDREGNGIIHGKVVEREIVPTYLLDSGDVEMTRLTIEVIDEVSVGATRGEKRKTVTAVFRGGETYWTSAQPSNDEIEVGVEAVFFLTDNPYADVFPGDLWIAGLNSVFKVTRSASGRRVVLGKGAGMAVSSNVHVETVLADHASALELVLREGR
jgi:hypothetical protein